MKQMMRMLLVLALVMCLLLCGAMAEETVSGATAKLHYTAGGYWPSTDGDMAASTTVQITGEGTYTLSVCFPDQGGWTAPANGIEYLYLIVEGAGAEGSVMDGLYIGVSDVRVNGTSVAIGTAAFGPTGYVNENVFTEEDGFSVLYDRWMLENSTVPLGHETWDGSEGTLAVVNPDDFVDVTRIDVNFFVTDTQGEKPEQEKETGALTIPAFTIPSQTYKTLAETGIPVADILAGIPDIQPVFSGNTVSIADIGDAVKDVYFFGMNMTELSLADGVWSAELTEDMTEAEMYGMVQFSLANGSLNYASSGWTQYTHYQNGTELCLDLYPTGGAVLSYGDRTVARFSNTYDAEGALTRHQVRIGQSYTEYNGDGSLFRMILVDENWNEFIYFGGIGWCADYWGEAPCEAPAGYEDVDLAWIYANFPHEIPGGIVVEPTYSLTIPDFTIPSQTYKTLAETGIPVADILAGIPDIQPVFSGNTVSIADIGDAVKDVYFFGMNMTELSLADGVWSAELTEDMTEAEMYGMVQFSLANGSLNYASSGWTQYTHYQNGTELCLDLYPTGGAVLSYGERTVARFSNTYDAEGELTRHQVRIGQSYTEYNGDGSLFRMILVDENWNEFIYFGGIGWCADYWGEAPCEAPAGYEDVDLAWIYANFPHEIPGGIVVEPTPVLALPEINFPQATYNTLAETGLDVDAILAAIPTELDISYADGLLKVKDPGAERMSWERRDPWGSGEFELVNGYWTAEFDEYSGEGFIFNVDAPEGDYRWNICYEPGEEMVQSYISGSYPDELVLYMRGGQWITLTTVYTADDMLISDEYLIDDGNLSRESIDAADGSMFVQYWGSGELSYFFVFTDTGAYMYNAGIGWETEPPAEYAHIDEEYVYTNVPHRIPGIACTEHDWVVSEAGIAPDCTRDGREDLLECQRCGATSGGDVIPALGHDLILGIGMAPTCTESGVTESLYCNRCGQMLVAGNVIPALGHDSITGGGMEPTCTANGMTDSLFCQRCGLILQAGEVIPALGHDMTVVAGYGATCVEDGLEDWLYCERCGLIENLIEIPALGHDLVITPGIEPTCTEDGMTDIVECLRCVLPDEENGGDVIPALGHSWVFVEAQAPTCTENGFTEGYICPACNATKDVEVIPAAGHPCTYVSGPVLEGTVGQIVTMAFNLMDCWVSDDCDLNAFELEVVEWNNEMIDMGWPVLESNGMHKFANWQLLKVGASQLTVSLPLCQIDPVTVDIIAHSAKPAVLPAGTVTIGEEAFMGTAVEEYVLPEGAEVIGSRAFADNANLKLINLPDSVTEISADAFEGCDNLTIICNADLKGSLEMLGIPCVVK